MTAFIFVKKVAAIPENVQLSLSQKPVASRLAVMYLYNIQLKKIYEMYIREGHGSRPQKAPMKSYCKFNSK
jgi:hypothetical protein